MKRFAANRIYLSVSDVFTNAIIELSDDKKLLQVNLLSEVSEIHSTPFYNGILLPFDKETCLQCLKDYLNDTLHTLFMERVFHIGDDVTSLSLLSGPKLFSTGELKQIEIKELL
ncbi:MAG: hypothetical protein IK017_12365 [Paludibacteraceae bacterium]|nr:hypothetical protein [Paludibacteraceae bacterium]MBR5973427.1 hypothetical protein [Paludibacteraceae bacterium]